jgi:ABC-type bacteriocin/lantibiotic exporter with double-glycine peptidase domain
VSQPLVAMVPQRHAKDCCAAVLAMFLGISYEDALLALNKEAPGMIRRGIYFTELRRAAKKIGVPLKEKRQWDAELDDGIAHIRHKNGANHVVLLRAGIVWDTDFTAWELPDYLKAKKARTGPLLVREDR